MPMSASMWMLVLLLLSLHLKSHHTKNFLVKVDTGNGASRNSNRGLPVQKYPGYHLLYV